MAAGFVRFVGADGGAERKKQTQKKQ